MVGFRVDVDRLVVRFSVGVVRPVSQVQRNVQEVCELQKNPCVVFDSTFVYV